MGGTETQALKDLRQHLQGVPEVVRSRIDAIICATEQIFGFLGDLGYYIDKAEISDDGLHRYRTSIVWRNPQLKQEVSVSYLPYDHEGQESDTVTVFIIKLPSSAMDAESFDASRQFMNLKMYLESKYPEFDKTTLSISSHGGSFRERVEKVLHAYAFYMQDAAEGVIRGEDWEVGHFHSWQL